MKINTYPITVSLDEADLVAGKKGTPLSKIVMRGKQEYHLKLMYIEYKLIEYGLTFRPSALEKLINKIFRKESFDAKSRIIAIGNGTSGSVAVVADMPDIITKNVNKDEIQESVFSDDHFIVRGEKTVRKLVRRRTGGFPGMDVLKITKVFRPFYVAYYGEMIEGNKVRYLTIPADGCSSRRSN